MRRDFAFTLPEILVAVFIFAVVVTTIANIYSRSFGETRRSNLQNQIYEDARFTVNRIISLISGGMIDYEEYYNQSVILLGGSEALPGDPPFSIYANFGQNYGRYSSSFYYPGSDRRLGFDCNDGSRNSRECTPRRKTLDKNTGANPFPGKFAGSSVTDENAFCATVSYGLDGTRNNKGKSPDGRDMCNPTTGLPDSAANSKQRELYLISADGRYKTILAREKIGAASYVLSMLKMEGYDTNGDKVYDTFICAPEYQCRSDGAPVSSVSRPLAPECGGPSPQQLPRMRDLSLEHKNDTCDTIDSAFSKDFVPISPFRITIQDLSFSITPLENPHNAFAEDDTQFQPRITVALTAAANPDYVKGELFTPITIVETFSTKIKDPVPSPLLVN